MENTQTDRDRLAQCLSAQGLTISAAESCTGGLFLSTLTDVAGSSAFVTGGVVAYSNAVKQQMVGVREQTLIDHGAVSEQTAHELAAGVRALLQTDIGVGITGIAGPGGGTAEKPVGLVYIGVALDGQTAVRRYVWDGDRARNKALSVEAAITQVLDMLG